MNKLFSLLSCAALAGALTACSSGSSDNSQDSEPSFAAAVSATVTSSATSEESTAAPSLKVVDEQYFMVNEMTWVVLIRDGYCFVKQGGSYATCQMTMVDTPQVETPVGMDSADTVSKRESGQLEFVKSMTAGLPGGGLADSAPKRMEPGTRTTIQGITLTNDFDGTFAMESGGSVATFTPDGHVSIN
ncbi:hypothetical protein WU85_03080 [Corynebacterium striatum]|nr:hypothetical protein WU85_03080 [Corynebacterium striatum]